MSYYSHLLVMPGDTVSALINILLREHDVDRAVSRIAEHLSDTARRIYASISIAQMFADVLGSIIRDHGRSATVLWLNMYAEHMSGQYREVYPPASVHLVAITRYNGDNMVVRIHPNHALQTVIHIEWPACEVLHKMRRTHAQRYWNYYWLIDGAIRDANTYDVNALIDSASVQLGCTKPRHLSLNEFIL